MCFVSQDASISGLAVRDFDKIKVGGTRRKANLLFKVELYSRGDFEGEYKRLLQGCLRYMDIINDYYNY